jgi:hypothetical protein
MSKHKNRNEGARKIPVVDKNTGETTVAESPTFQKPFSPNVPTHSEQDLVCENKTESLDSSTSQIVEPVKKEKKESETLEQFVEGFYSGKIKSLTSDRVRKISKHVFDAEKRAPLVTQASKNDLSLEKSKQLMALVATLGSYSTIQHTIGEFVRDAVASHPIMATHNIELWFPLAGSTGNTNIELLFSDIGAALKVVAKDKKDVEAETDNDKKSSSDLKKARLNVFYISVIWRYSKNLISFTEFIRTLRATVFRFESNKTNIDSDVLEFLVSAQGKEITSFASLMQWYADLAENDRNNAEAARRKAEALAKQLDERDSEFVTAQNEIKGYVAEIEALRKQVADAHEKERVQGIHMRADQQFQKGRTLRILEEEIPILADCLKALERDPPKLLVAKEYVGSVLEKLSKELNDLKGN